MKDSHLLYPLSNDPKQKTIGGFDPKNPKPGIYYIPIHEYHRVLTGVVSNSYLGKLDDCPAKAKILDVETPALLFGRALHAYTLDRGQWDREFALVPDKPVFLENKNKNTYKDAYATFQAENVGKQIVSRSDYDTIRFMYDAMMQNIRVKEILTGGLREVTAIWQDVGTERNPGTGLWCKVRPDLIPDKTDSVIVDLKKTASAKRHKFQTAIVTYGYARQGAMFLYGLSQVTGKPYDRDGIFAMVAVEDDEPYRTEVYPLDDEFLKYGFSEFRRLMRVELHCREQNYWPNFTPANLLDLRQASFEPIMMPGYLKEGPWENDTDG